MTRLSTVLRFNWAFAWSVTVAHVMMGQEQTGGLDAGCDVGPLLFSLGFSAKQSQSVTRLLPKALSDSMSGD